MVQKDRHRSVLLYLSKSSLRWPLHLINNHQFLNEFNIRNTHKLWVDIHVVLCTNLCIKIWHVPWTTGETYTLVKMNSFSFHIIPRAVSSSKLQMKFMGALYSCLFPVMNQRQSIFIAPKLGRERRMNNDWSNINTAWCSYLSLTEISGPQTLSAPNQRCLSEGERLCRKQIYKLRAVQQVTIMCCWRSSNR